MDRPELMLADRHEHGPVVARLLKAHTGGYDDLDWSDIGENWILAVLGSEVVGCVQVLPGYPVGRAEMLGLADSLTTIQRAAVVSALIEQACLTLQIAGCGVVQTSVAHELSGFTRSLERRGFHPVCDGQILARRMQA